MRSPRTYPQIRSTKLCGFPAAGVRPRQAAVSRHNVIIVFNTCQPIRAKSVNTRRSDHYPRFPTRNRRLNVKTRSSRWLKARLSTYTTPLSPRLVSRASSTSVSA